MEQDFSSPLPIARRRRGSVPQRRGDRHRRAEGQAEACRRRRSSLIAPCSSHPGPSCAIRDDRPPGQSRLPLVGVKVVVTAMNALFGSPDDAPRLPWGVSRRRVRAAFAGNLMQPYDRHRIVQGAHAGLRPPGFAGRASKMRRRVARDFRGSRSRGDRACTASSGEQSRRGFVWLSLRPQIEQTFRRVLPPSW